MSKTFAVLLGDVVSNVLVAKTKADAELASGAECIEYTDENLAGIGWTYDRTTKEFSNPIGGVSPIAIEEPTV